MTSEHLLYTGIAGCVIGIVHLYTRIELRNKFTEKRLDECEKERIELKIRVGVLEFITSKFSTTSPTIPPKTL